MIDRMPHRERYLSEEEVLQALNTPDLTEPQYEHGIRTLYSIVESVAMNLGINNTCIIRKPPLVSTTDHFDKLLFTPDAGVRSCLNSRYVSNELMLRGHTAANIPPVLESFATTGDREILIVSPGICFRSKASDRQHASIMHQVDLWYAHKEQLLDEDEILSLAGDIAQTVAENVLPNHSFQHHDITNPSKSHPYLSRAIKIKAYEDKKDNQLTALEYGAVSPQLLKNTGLAGGTACAVGIILERSLMLRKKIPDVRLIASQDPRVITQMTNLDTYRDISSFNYSRDVSLLVTRDDIDTLMASVQSYVTGELGVGAEVEMISSTSYTDLPAHVRDRRSMAPNQVNALLNITFRPNNPSDRATINALRDKVLLRFSN